jgi:hypothetical protein
MYSNFSSLRNAPMTPEFNHFHKQPINTENNSLIAINAYLNVIRSKGVNGVALSERNEFLSKFNWYLESSPKTKRAFREALKIMLDNCKRSEWTFYLTISREYLPFWLNDIKSIAALSKENEFNLDISRYSTQLFDINSLRDQVLSTSFSTIERWALNNYAEFLRQDLEMSGNNAIKLIMAKMIVIGIRPLSLSRISAYKMSVDLLIPSFESNKARSLFVDVSINFFPFYDGQIITNY